ncbi:hypothetical protein HJC99_05005 [Candidatus Saccharibacteria bacterium]|nr:hypothetical protein [Candidatus Saccharibacteria bacterium]
MPKWLSITVSALVFAAMVVVSLSLLMSHHLYVVRTGSMGNTYPPKTLVVVKVGEYHVGQVISFREHGDITTHRLLGFNADGTLITKGDANDTPDPWTLHRSDIIGGVTGSVRGLGYWFIYAKNPYGLGSMVCLVLAIWLSIKLYREMTPETDAESDPPDNSLEDLILSSS